MTELQRTTLIQQATYGDADALQRMIIEYHDALHAAVACRISTRLCGRLDPDDVLQDAYLAAFRTVVGLRFENPAKFYRWLEQIALSRLIDHERAAKRQKRGHGCLVPTDASGYSCYHSFAHTLISKESTPSWKAARSEAVAALLTSLARLTDDQRDVIRLRFLEGLPVSDVAARLGKTDDAVHGLCRRGLIALREALVSISRYISRS